MFDPYIAKQAFYSCDRKFVAISDVQLKQIICKEVYYLKPVII